MRPLQTEDKSSTSAVTESTDSKVTVAEWRYGPAQLWYDMLEVDHAGQHFDYGFKLKTVCMISFDDFKKQFAIIIELFQV